MIHTIEKYTHKFKDGNSAEVYVNSAVKGKHKEHGLCHRCVRFKPNTAQNCIIAQRLFQICVDYNVTTPVYECPAFIQAATIDPDHNN